MYRSQILAGLCFVLWESWKPLVCAQTHRVQERMPEAEGPSSDVFKAVCLCMPGNISIVPRGTNWKIAGQTITVSFVVTP